MKVNWLLLLVGDRRRWRWKSAANASFGLVSALCVYTVCNYDHHTELIEEFHMKDYKFARYFSGIS